MNVNWDPKVSKQHMKKAFCTNIFLIYHQCFSCEYLQEFSKKVEISLKGDTQGPGKKIHEINNRFKMS